jgi:hypothetical protein
MIDHDAHETMLAMLRKQRPITPRPEPRTLSARVILAIACAVGAVVGLAARFLL